MEAELNVENFDKKNIFFEKYEWMHSFQLCSISIQNGWICPGVNSTALGFSVKDWMTDDDSYFFTRLYLFCAPYYLKYFPSYTFHKIYFFQVHKDNPAEYRSTNLSVI